MSPSLSSKWKWRVTGYYASDVKPPKKPGDMALQTVHTTDVSKDLEVDIFNQRDDIGSVVVEQLHD